MHVISAYIEYKKKEKLGEKGREIVKLIGIILRTSTIDSTTKLLTLSTLRILRVPDLTQDPLCAKFEPKTIDVSNFTQEACTKCYPRNIGVPNLMQEPYVYQI